MRAWDCVLISPESDLALLEARFAEYADLPVIHVIAECPADYQGRAKPMHFADSSLWNEYRGKWNHVRVEPHELPWKDADARTRKNAMREYLAHGVGAEPDDIILHGGIDEIPAAWAVEEIMSGKTLLPIGTEMRWCCYRPDLIHPLPWRGTVAQKWKYTGSFSGLREQKDSLPAIVGAGTRLSMMNEELPEDGLHPDGHALRKTEIDGTFPAYVRSSREEGA